MGNAVTTSYLKDATELFHSYKTLAERAMAQCPDQHLCTALDAESNSIAVLVKHLAGNMRSRWIDFLTTDGEKPGRQRDTEFENLPATRGELHQLWEQGWQCLFDAMDSLTDADLHKTVTIRQTPYSVLQAINRSLTHYAQHAGQIVFLSKHFAVIATGEWKSLSVPRARSGQVTAAVAAGEKKER